MLPCKDYSIFLKLFNSPNPYSDEDNNINGKIIEINANNQGKSDFFGNEPNVVENTDPDKISAYVIK